MGAKPLALQLSLPSSPKGVQLLQQGLLSLRQLRRHLPSRLHNGLNPPQGSFVGGGALPKPTGRQRSLQHAKRAGMTAQSHGIQPGAPGRINSGALNQRLHGLQFWIEILWLPLPACHHQPLQGSAPQRDPHEITEADAQLITVAVAECTAVPTRLQPHINLDHPLGEDFSCHLGCSGPPQCWGCR